MASAADWASGYLAQAKVDLHAVSQPVDASVRAMLLQMAFEKIAKAALLKNRQWKPEKAQATHRGATHMMTVLLWPENLKKLGFERGEVEHRLKPAIQHLESLHPANATVGPWLEYPWLTGDDKVATPCANLPDLEVYGASSTLAARLMLFGRALIKNHHLIFS